MYIYIYIYGKAWHARKGRPYHGRVNNVEMIEGERERARGLSTYTSEKLAIGTRPSRAARIGVT